MRGSLMSQVSGVHLVLAFTFWALAPAAYGATVFVDPEGEDPPEFAVEVEQSVDLVLVVRLDPSEDASVFEGQFELVESGGAGPVAAVVIEADPPAPDLQCAAPLDPRSCTWDGVSADIVESVARLSLFSDNRSGERRLGTLEVTGLAPGTLEVVLLDDSFCQRDTPGPPYLADVALSPVGGTVLARIVVPEPGRIQLIAAALLTVAALRRRHATGVADHGKPRP